MLLEVVVVVLVGWVCFDVVFVEMVDCVTLLAIDEEAKFVLHVVVERESCDNFVGVEFTEDNERWVLRVGVLMAELNCKKLNILLAIVFFNIYSV